MRYTSGPPRSPCGNIFPSTQCLVSVPAIGSRQLPDPSHPTNQSLRLQDQASDWTSKTDSKAWAMDWPWSLVWPYHCGSDWRDREFPVGCFLVATSRTLLLRQNASADSARPSLRTVGYSPRT